MQQKESPNLLKDMREVFISPGPGENLINGVFLKGYNFPDFVHSEVELRILLDTPTATAFPHTEPHAYPHIDLTAFKVEALDLVWILYDSFPANSFTLDDIVLKAGPMHPPVIQDGEDLDAGDYFNEKYHGKVYYVKLFRALIAIGFVIKVDDTLDFDTSLRINPYLVTSFINLSFTQNRPEVLNSIAEEIPIQMLHSQSHLL